MLRFCRRHTDSILSSNANDEQCASLLRALASDYLKDSDIKLSVCSLTGYIDILSIMAFCAIARMLRIPAYRCSS